MNNNKSIVLTPVKAFAVYASDDDKSGSIKGYYSTRIIAEIKTKGAGWYGSNGEVLEKTLYSDGTNIYEVKNLGMFGDVAEKFKEDMTASIKSKLTQAEWDFLNKQK